MNNNREREENRDNDTWWNVAAFATGLAVGGLYLLTRPESEEENRYQQAYNSRTEQRSRVNNNISSFRNVLSSFSNILDMIEDADNSIQQEAHCSERERRLRVNDDQSGGSGLLSFLSNTFDRIELESPSNNYNAIVEPNSIGISPPPDSPVIKNLDTLLKDIYERFIALKSYDFELHYKVFDTILLRLHENMKEENAYYKRYSSIVQLAGSHFDRLKIEKPDEFDVDIIIGLPLNLRMDRFNPERSDIIMEHLSPGYVQLKMGEQYRQLPYRDRGADWEIHKPLFTWKDDNYYLLRSKFSDWFKGLVNRGMNRFHQVDNRRLCYVEGIPYIISVSQSGPAMTLKIANDSRGFKMDFDLVPALKFFEDRWPADGGYRTIPEEYSSDIFMIVPKPLKGERASNDASRSWRMSLIYQERKMLHGTYNLRQIIRFLKKLRDAQGMCHIASYYIKTLFLWEVTRRDDDFWRQSLAKLFVIMVKKFRDALVDGQIPYFWNSDHNLIGGVRREIVVGYAAKLNKLVQILDNPTNYVKVAPYLLTPSEWENYQRILYMVGVYA